MRVRTYVHEKYMFRPACSYIATYNVYMHTTMGVCMCTPLPTTVFSWVVQGLMFCDVHISRKLQMGMMLKYVESQAITTKS